MPNSHTEVFIHLVWTTSERQPLITPQIERVLYSCIAARCRDLQAHLMAIGGISDHVHLLIRLPATLTIAQIAKDIKGASSHLITHKLSQPDFRWQSAYSAFGVSPEGVEAVCNYIQNQKQHHAQRHTRPEWEIED
jgi:REP element-mobilizing transposase RayT